MENGELVNNDLVLASGLIIRARQHIDSSSAIHGTSITGIKGKLYHVLQSGFLSDITFHVGENEVPFQAHKLILAFSSSVFEAMFYGPVKEISSSIKISDVEPEAFSLMLEYMYTRNVPAKICIQTSISGFYLARKYELPDLERILLRQLMDSVTADTAATLLSTAKLFDLIRLEKICWECIDLDSAKFFASEDFRNLDELLLKRVISRDNLVTSELGIYKAVVSWGEAVCASKEIPVLPHNVRKVLQDIISLIRFPLMEPEEFVNGPAQSGILSPEEISNVMVTKFATGQDKPRPIFSPKKRNLKADSGGRNLSCICQHKRCMYCNPFSNPNSEERYETVHSRNDSDNCVVLKKCIGVGTQLPLYCSCRTRGYCPDKRVL